MTRENLIKAVEKETKEKVNTISWIYGIGEDVGDGEVLYNYDITLQIETIGGNYLSITAENCCTDRSRVIESTISYYELYDFYSDFDENSEVLESTLFDYLESYGDRVDKPKLDHVFFEPM